MLGAAACGRCGWSPLGAAPVPPAQDLGGGDPFLGGDSPAPAFAPPPPPPPGYTPPPPPAPGSLAAQVAPATSTARPVPQGGSSGCGCLSFIVLIAVAAAGVGIFFGIRDADDAFDGVRDVFEDSPFDDDDFDGDRTDMPPVTSGAALPLQELGDGEVGVHPLEGATGTVTIRVIGDDSFDPFIRVESADGDALGEDDDGGDSTDSLLTIDLSDEPGAVLLVREFGEEAGTYTVVVLEGTGSAPPRTGDELAVGEPTGGIILDAGQQVSHPFTGTGAPVSISVSSVAGFDPVVTVFDATGNQLATNDDFSTETGRDARVDLTVAAGAQVTVQVSGFGSSTGPYLVTVAAG